MSLIKSIQRLTGVVPGVTDTQLFAINEVDMGKTIVKITSRDHTSNSGSFQRWRITSPTELTADFSGSATGAWSVEIVEYL